MKYRLLSIICLVLMIATVLPFALMNVEAEGEPSLIQLGENKQLTDTGVAVAKGEKFIHLYDDSMTKNAAISYAADMVKSSKIYRPTGNDKILIVYSKNGSNFNCIMGEYSSSDSDNIFWAGFTGPSTLKEIVGDSVGDGYQTTQQISGTRTGVSKCLYYKNVYVFGTVEDYPVYSWNTVNINTYSLSITSSVNETNAKMIAAKEITSPTGNEYVVFGTNGRKYKYLVYSGGQWTYTSDNQKYAYELRNTISKDSKKVYVIGTTSDLDAKYQGVTLQEITADTRNLTLFDGDMSSSVAETLRDDFIDQGLIDFGNNQYPNDIQIYYSINDPGEALSGEYNSLRYDQYNKAWKNNLYTSPEEVIEKINRGVKNGYAYKFYIFGTASGLKSSPTVSQISYNTKTYELQNNFYVSPEEAASIANQAVKDGKMTQDGILVYNYDAYYSESGSSYKGSYDYIYYKDGAWKYAKTGGLGKDRLISFIISKEIEGKSCYLLGTTTSYEDGEVVKYMGAALSYNKKTGVVSVSNAAADPASYTFTTGGGSETEKLVTSYEIVKNSNSDDYYDLIGQTTRVYYLKNTVSSFATISFSDSGIKTLDSETSSFTIQASDYSDADKADLHIAARRKYGYVDYDDTNKTKTYAVYEYQYFALPNKITFDLNGGKIGDSSDDVVRYLMQGTALDKQTAELDADPTLDGSEFVGWFDAATGGNEVTTLSTRANITLYAQYKTVPTAGLFDYTAPSDLVYDGSGKTAAVTVKTEVAGLTADDITVNYYSDENCTKKIAGNPTDAGTYYVGIDVSETDTYASCTALKVGSFEIAKANGLTVTAPESLTKIYDKQPLSGEATANVDGYTITYQTKATEDDQYGTSSSLIPSVTDAGTLYIKATATHKNYVDASVEYKLTVSKRQLSITDSTADGKGYDSTITAVVHLGTVSGKIDGDDVTVNASGNFEDKNVGNGKEVTITYSLTGTQKDNYIEPADSITVADIVSAAVSVFGTKIKTREYDGTTDAEIETMGTLNGVFAGDIVEIDADNVVAAFASKDADSDAEVNIQYALKGDDAGNYTVSNGVESSEIEKRSVVLTSSSGYKTYDGIPLEGEVTVSGIGFVEGEANVSASSITNAGEITNEIIVTEGQNYIADNYDIEKNEGTLEVKRRSVTLTSASASKAYDGSELRNTEVKVTKGSFVAGEGLDESTEASGYIEDIGIAENVFDYILDDNTKEDNYDITKVYGTLMVTEPEGSKYHIDFDSLTNVLNDMSQAQELPLTGILFNIDEENINLDEFEIIKQNNSDKLFIPLNISVTLGFFNEYGDPEQIFDCSPNLITFSYDFDFSLNKDVIVCRIHDSYTEMASSPEYSVLTTEPNEYGEYIELDKENNRIIVHASRFSTYAIGYEVKEVLQVTADSITKVYDGQPLVVEAVAGEMEGTTITYQTKLTENGEYGDPSEEIPSVTDASVLYVKATAENEEYLSGSKEYILTVSKKQLTVSGTKVEDKIYDGTADAEITVGKLEGVITGEDVSVSVSGTFADRNAGEDKKIAVTYSISGESIGNYLAPAAEEITADIFKKDIKVKADNKSSVVENELKELTYKADELIEGDIFTGALATTADKSIVGEYVINRGTLSIEDGNEGKNYNIEFTDGEYTVSEKSLVYTGDSTNIWIWTGTMIWSFAFILVLKAEKEKKRNH